MRCLLILSVLMLTAAIVFSIDVTIQPDPDEGKDTMITNYVSSVNFGDWIHLTENLSGGPWDTRGMVEFNLGKYFDPSKKFKVETATMSFNHRYNYPRGRTWYLYRITDSWDEMTVTYDNRPDYNTTPASSVVCQNEEGWEDFDVKDIIQKWLDKTYQNYGVYLWMGSAQDNLTYFKSSDFETASECPKLCMKYNEIIAILPVSLGDIKALYK